MEKNRGKIIFVGMGGGFRYQKVFKKFWPQCIFLKSMTPPYHLTQLCCCTLCDSCTVSGLLCLLFLFYCFINSFLTVNSILSLNTVTHASS